MENESDEANDILRRRMEEERLQFLRGIQLQQGADRFLGVQDLRQQLQQLNLPIATTAAGPLVFSAADLNDVLAASRGHLPQEQDALARALQSFAAQQQFAAQPSGPRTFVLPTPAVPQAAAPGQLSSSGAQRPPSHPLQPAANNDLESPAASNAGPPNLSPAGTVDLRRTLELRLFQYEQELRLAEQYDQQRRQQQQHHHARAQAQAQLLGMLQYNPVALAAPTFASLSLGEQYPHLVQPFTISATGLLQPSSNYDDLLAAVANASSSSASSARPPAPPTGYYQPLFTGTNRAVPPNLMAASTANLTNSYSAAALVEKYLREGAGHPPQQQPQPQSQQEPAAGTTSVGSSLLPGERDKTAAEMLLHWPSTTNRPPSVKGKEKEKGKVTTAKTKSSTSRAPTSPPPRIRRGRADDAILSKRADDKDLTSSDEDDDGEGGIPDETSEERSTDEVTASPKKRPQLVPIPASRRSTEELEAIKAKARAFAMQDPVTKGGRKKKTKAVLTLSPNMHAETPPLSLTGTAPVEAVEALTTVGAITEQVPVNRKRRKEPSSAYRKIPNPYTAPGGDMFHVTPKEILEAMPPDTSCVFHLFDRKINMDAHPEDASFYSLLRSWVQDDPCRVIPDRSNLMDNVRPSASCARSSGKKRRLVPRNAPTAKSNKRKADVLSILSSDCDSNDCSQGKGVQEKGDKSKDSVPPAGNVADLLAEHVKKAKRLRKKRCLERKAEINRFLPRLQRLGINVSSALSGT